jgi:hypothetical protein
MPTSSRPVAVVKRLTGDPGVRRGSWAGNPDLPLNRLA